MWSIFPSCTILDKEQECEDLFYDSRHPLRVFVQDVFPSGELVCGAKAKETVPESCHCLNTCGLF